MSAAPSQRRTRRDSRSVSIEKLQKLQKIRNKVRRDSFARYKDIAPPPLPNAAVMSALTGGKEIPQSLPPAPPPPPAALLNLEPKFEEESKDGDESEGKGEGMDVETKMNFAKLQPPVPTFGPAHKFALMLLSSCLRNGIKRIKRSSLRRWRAALLSQSCEQRAGALRLLWSFRERQQAFRQKKVVWRLLEAASRATALQEEVSRHIRKETEVNAPEPSPKETAEEEIAAVSERVVITEGRLKATVVRFMFYRWKIWHQSRVVEAVLHRERTSNERLVNRLSEINRRCQALERNSYAAHIVQATSTSRWEKARSFDHRPEVA